jgi:hypothetical protein
VARSNLELAAFSSALPPALPAPAPAPAPSPSLLSPPPSLPRRFRALFSPPQVLRFPFLLDDPTLDAAVR